MSYILDALKKSERERTLVRGIGFGDAGRRLVRENAWVPWAIAGAVSIVAVVVVTTLLLRIDTAAPTAEVQTPTATSAVVPSAAESVTDVVAKATPASVSEPEQKSLPPLTEGVVSASSVTPLLPADGEASWLSAMSPEYQQSVPPMTVNIHVYTPDEAQRILYINNRQFRRGEEVQGGVVVEDILPDGVVLQFRGQRFKLPRPS